MKECGVPENTVLGEICRRIPGTGKESCYLCLQVEEDSRETVELLEPLTKRTLGCPFRQKVLKRIKEKKDRILRNMVSRGLLHSDIILSYSMTITKSKPYTTFLK